MTATDIREIADRLCIAYSEENTIRDIVQACIGKQLSNMNETSDTHKFALSLYSPMLCSSYYDLSADEQGTVKGEEWVAEQNIDGVRGFLAVDTGNKCSALFVSRVRAENTALPQSVRVFLDVPMPHPKLRNFVADVRVDLFDCDYQSAVQQHGLSYMPKKDAILHFLLSGFELPYVVSVLDVVYINDNNICEKCYLDRREYTKKITEFLRKHVIIGHEVWKEWRGNDVIYKKLDSTYDTSGKRCKGWVKRKPSVSDKLGKPIYAYIFDYSVNSRVRVNAISLWTNIRMKSGNTMAKFIAGIDIPFSGTFRELLETRIDGILVFNPAMKGAVVQIDGTYFTRTGVLKNAFIVSTDTGKVKQDCVLSESEIMLLAEERVKKV